jgi:hypothetical protein
MIPGTLSSPLAEPHTQFGVQDDYADSPSFLHGQVEGTTLSPVAAQGQSATTSRQMKKKEKDVIRKRVQRLDDKQDFAKICELLHIELRPQKTLVHRSERLRIYPRRRY